MQEGLFELLLHPTKPQVSAANVCMTDKEKLWHQRLGHMGHNIINKSVKITKGIDVSGTSSREVCDDCELSKSHRQPRRQADNESFCSTEPLELVHSDLCSVNCESPGGSKYYVTLYDDCNAVSRVRFLKQKSDGANAVQDMILELERAFGSKVKRIKFDNAFVIPTPTFRRWSNTVAEYIVVYVQTLNVLR